jgi:hypothetical protein
MAKKGPAKLKGHPATTGKSTLVGLRCHMPFLQAVDEWRASQDDRPSRPAAIVRLARVGLSVSKPPKVTSAKSAAQASDMAGDLIDNLVDQSASAEVREGRKRQLVKGPEEFRGIRKDHPEKKGK